MLAELVKAGKLPPVQERVSAEPLVVKPLHGIGKYGGTWRRGFTGPGDTSNAHRAAQNDKLLYFDYTGTKLVPNIAKGWEVSPDGKVTTLTLRKGHKWSDGKPFTADDFMFWYEDVYQNKDLVGTPLASMTINGKPVKIEKGDEVTVRFVSPDPYYAMPNVLAAVLNLGHHARFGRDAWGGYAPAHYLKQFLPKYAGQDAVDKMAKENNFDGWVNQFKLRNDSTRNLDLPTLAPWKVTARSPRRTSCLERNPYSIWVDTDGNQLPYIDKVQMTAGREPRSARTCAPSLASTTSRPATSTSASCRSCWRTSSAAPTPSASIRRPRARMSACSATRASTRIPEIAKWLQNREFRIALSHGFDRSQINETFVLGPAPDRLGRAGRGHALLPRAGVQDAPLRVRPEEGERAAGQDRPDQEGRRGVPPAHRQRPAAPDRADDATSASCRSPAWPR